MFRTEISKDEPLQPGDVIEMHFKAFGPGWLYLRAAELAVLKWQLSKKNPDYELTAWDSISKPDKLILTFRVLEPKESEPQIQQASAVTIVAIAAIVIGGGLFTWLSLETIYKITDSPQGKLALAGSGLVGVAAVLIAVLLLLKYYQD